MHRTSDRGTSAHKHAIQFFLIAFGASWLLWLPSLLRSTVYGDLPAEIGIFGILAPFGPSIAAFWLLRQSKVARKKLWLSGWRIDAGRWWLLAALLIGPVIGLLTAALVVLTGGTVDWTVGVPPLAIVPVFLMIYFMNALPEEYGWRGYVLRPLTQRFGFLWASIVLGFLWGLWHLPLAFIDGTTQAAIPFYEFVVQTIALAIVYSWLFFKTKGSVLAVALFHASANIAGAAIPTWTTAEGRWINFALWLVVVALVLWGVRKDNWGYDSIPRKK